MKKLASVSIGFIAVEVVSVILPGLRNWILYI